MVFPKRAQFSIFLIGSIQDYDSYHLLNSYELMIINVNLNNLRWFLCIRGFMIILLTLSFSPYLYSDGSHHYTCICIR